MPKEKRLKIYATRPEKYSACAYYRIEVPLRTMNKLGLAHYWIPTYSNKDLDFQAQQNSGIVLQWMLQGAASQRYAELFKELQVDVKDGMAAFPPLLVMDSDDALDLTIPTNHSFASFGVRDWKGNLLKPGATISHPLPNGKEQLLWKDKETHGQDEVLFDVERNLYNMAHHYEAARLCAGVTVSTEFLAEHYRREGVENVHVFPNSIIPEDYPQPRLMPHKGVRLIWEGGSAHTDAWASIRQPLKEILERNPDVTLVVFGGAPATLEKDFRAEQLERHGWIDYHAYKYARVLLDADINLCPLIDYPFNRAKSAIRWYEGCMAPNAEAALAADVEPYKEIKDGETGLLYRTKQEFAEKLQLLIDDAKLRARLGTAGREWILENRHAEKTVPALFEFYQKLKEEQKSSYIRGMLAEGVS